jgi:hypothetical protein
MSAPTAIPVASPCAHSRAGKRSPTSVQARTGSNSRGACRRPTAGLRRRQPARSRTVRRLLAIPSAWGRQLTCRLGAPSAQAAKQQEEEPACRPGHQGPRLPAVALAERRQEECRLRWSRRSLPPSPARARGLRPTRGAPRGTPPRSSPSARAPTPPACPTPALRPPGRSRAPAPRPARLSGAPRAPGPAPHCRAPAALRRPGAGAGRRRRTGPAAPAPSASAPPRR